MPEVFSEKTLVSEAVERLTRNGFDCGCKSANQQHCLKATFDIVCNSFLEIKLNANDAGFLTEASVSNIEKGCL